MAIARVIPPVFFTSKLTGKERPFMDSFSLNFKYLQAVQGITQASSVAFNGRLPDFELFMLQGHIVSTSPPSCEGELEILFGDQWLP
jgi:hypothetical protein